MCRGSAAALASTLRAGLAAAQAAHALVSAPGLSSPEAYAAAAGLAELLPWAAGRKAVVNALVCVPGALPRCLDLVRVRA
jgi:hypothetical protein